MKFVMKTSKPDLSQSFRTHFFNSMVLTIVIVVMLGVVLWFVVMMVLMHTIAQFANLLIFIILTILWFMIWLWCTESLWFGLTCRQFAQKQGREWVFYGAFGRIRYRFPVGTPCDYLRSNRADDYVRIWHKNGSIAYFYLGVCRDASLLMTALKAKDNEIRRQRLLKQYYQNLPPYIQRYKRYFIVLLSAWCIISVILMAQMALNFTFVAWQVAGLLTILWGVPILWWLLPAYWRLRPMRYYPKSVRHWRLYWAEGMFYGKCTIMVLLGGIFLSWINVYCVGAMSIWGQTEEKVQAQIVAKHACGRNSHRAQYQLQFPTASELNGYWCSSWRRSVPIDTGQVVTVTVKRSIFARQVIFPKPPQ